MKRSKVIDNANIKAGDVIVGLASLVTTYEKVIMAVWEATDLTSARHDVFWKIFGNQIPESYDAAVPRLDLFRTTY
jgi:phosphoribosylformylglycinamidine cyclo-ligase